MDRIRGAHATQIPLAVVVYWTFRRSVSGVCIHVMWGAMKTGNWQGPEEPKSMAYTDLNGTEKWFKNDYDASNSQRCLRPPRTCT